MTDEGVLDPWVVDWMAANPERAQPLDEFSPELLALARMDVTMIEGPEVAKVADDVIAGVKVRIYEHTDEPLGVVVYFHGGGFCIGSVGIMDHVAREIAVGAHVAVVSVDYRLAPDDPYPAGLDDCLAVTRWVLDNASRFASDPRVVVAGESAGGNLSTAVALRLRDSGDDRLAGQVLIYPGVAGGTGDFESRALFDGVVLSAKGMQWFSSAYSGGRDISRDPYAAPLNAESLRGLPRALVLLGGCDVLRDEGRAYAARLADEGVAVDEVCYPGQPHGFMNFGFPAAADAFTEVGRWLQSVFAPAD